MHSRIAFNFGKFKSRKCSISFSCDYVRKEQKNKKALKNQGFSTDGEKATFSLLSSLLPLLRKSRAGDFEKSEE